MTPDERQQFFMETEDSVRQFAALVEARNSGSTGIPKAPEVSVLVVTATETESEPERTVMDIRDS